MSDGGQLKVYSLLTRPQHHPTSCLFGAKTTHIGTRGCAFVPSLHQQGRRRPTVFRRTKSVAAAKHFIPGPSNHPAVNFVIWKDKVLPVIKKPFAEHASHINLHLVLYQETTIINLLEVILYVATLFSSGAELLPVEVVYFKTGASEHVGLCTHDGRIDFCRLSREFKLDPTTVKLNGILLSLVKPLSEETWENIEKYFKTNGEPVGGKNDHVIVTGETAVPAVSTDLSFIWKEMKSIMEISLLHVNKEWKEMKSIIEISLLSMKKQLQYTKSKMSRGLNNNFKATLIDFYGVDKIDSSPIGSKNAKHHGN